MGENFWELNGPQCMESAEHRAGRKTRNSLARSTRSLMARLELDSFYNEPARFITSQLVL